MALIEWESEFSVGVFEIDNQHKQLVKIINTLFDAMKQGAGNKVLGRIIGELITYTQTHFSTEEKYFKLFNYKEIDSHIAEHKIFTNEVNKFKTDFDSGKIAMTISVLSFLKDWLLNHIVVEDKKYELCFKQNGLV